MRCKCESVYHCGEDKLEIRPCSTNHKLNFKGRYSKAFLMYACYREKQTESYLCRSFLLMLNLDNLISHFRVPLSFCFKTSHGWHLEMSFNCKTVNAQERFIAKSIVLHYYSVLPTPSIFFSLFPHFPLFSTCPFFWESFLLLPFFVPPPSLRILRNSCPATRLAIGSNSQS